MQEVSQQWKKMVVHLHTHFRVVWDGGDGVGLVWWCRGCGGGVWWVAVWWGGGGGGGVVHIFL